MLVGQQGYVPEPYFLTETLRSQTRFHDPFQDSLFSHSGSVQGFRDWSNGSGRSSPQPTSPTGTITPSPLHRTLLVRSSRPIGQSHILLPNQQQLKNQPRCVKISEDLYEAHLPSLVTPRSTVPGGTGSKAIRYAILEVSQFQVIIQIVLLIRRQWNPLLDSSNMEIEGTRAIISSMFNDISEA